jgi:hypothetical protein
MIGKDHAEDGAETDWREIFAMFDRQPEASTRNGPVT